MSLGSQDITEAREAREYWEGIVSETEGDVRFDLSCAHFSRDQNTDLLDRARMLGMATEQNDEYVATVWFDGQGYHADILRATS